jgi:dihydrodipicolinate synthase/N-acetylneuraminate lyase
MYRRQFIQLLGAAAADAARPSQAATDSRPKPIEGVFPIAQSPFTDADKLDTDTLVEELRFIDRGRVHGFVWPQLASEWSTLSESERLAGTDPACR